MPLYSIQGPDGKTYTIEGPAGATREQVIDAIQYKLSQQAQPTPEPKSAGFSVSDIFTSLGQGAVGSAKALTDVAGADNAASRKLQEASEALQQRLSPERQAELKRQQERAQKAAASGSTWEEIKAAAQSIGEAPLQSTAQALGSFLPYIPTMFLGPAASALGLGARATAAATNVAKAAPAAIGTAQGAGAVKGAIYDSVYEAERKDGVPEDVAKAKAVAAQEYFGKNIDQILLGGGAGYVAGKFGAERLLTPGAAATAERSLLGRVGTAVATDMPTEAFQGGQEQLASNLALQREGRDVPLMQGVAGAATQEGLMGALGAVPVAAARGPGNVALREEQDRRAQESARLQAEADARRAEQDAFRQTPEYLDTLEQRFAQIKAMEQQLKEAIPGKVDKNDPLAVEEKRRALEALNEFKKSDEYVNTIDEYTEAYDQLRPRMKERKAAELEQQRVERVQTAPEGTQLDLLGEPGAVPDQSLSGQIQSLNQYIGSFDKQIKQAQAAGDTQQAALLQQKQGQARDQIASLLPDPSMLADAKALAQRNLETYRTQIKTLTEQADKKPEQYRQLEQLNNTTKQISQAIAGIEDTQNIVAKYKPVETQKPIDKAKTLATLEKQLGKQAVLGEDIGPTLQKIRELGTVAEQPALFGEEDLRTVTPRGLGDIIADERERVVALREKLDGERAALQRMATTPQTQLTEEVQRRKRELVEEAKKTAEELRQRNQDLVDVERLQQLQTQLGKQRSALVAQNKPIPEQLNKRFATLGKDIESITMRLKAREPVREGQKELAPAAPEGDFAPRVTDAQLMEQRDRDIAALLDQFLPGALGVTPTQETLQIQGPEGLREVQLTTLGGESYQALRQELANVEERRNAAVERLFESGGATADALRSEIVLLVTREVELKRQIDRLEPLSAEYRQDLQSLVRQAFTRPSAIPRNRTPNAAEQQYLNAVENLQRVEDATLNAIYEMNKLAYNARRRGVVDITNLVQNDPVMQAGRAAQAQISAAQRRVDEAAKNMPQLPDLTDATLDDKLDALAKEFAEGTPKELAARSKARRVPTERRPAALLGADIPAQIAANERQIEQLNRDIQYAGKPSDAEKIAALDALKTERDQRKEENKRLTEQYNQLQAEGAPEETGEVAEMRQELATIERTLAAGTFKDNFKVELQLMLARDELKKRIESAVGPARSDEAALKKELNSLKAELYVIEEGIFPEDKEKIPLLTWKINQLEGQLGFRADAVSKFRVTELKPVPADDITKAKNAVVAATQKIEDIRKAAGRVADMGPKYFQEVATTYQQRIEKEAADANKLKNRGAALEKFISEYQTILKNPNLESAELVKRVPTLRQLAKAVGQSQFLSEWETASKKSGVTLPKAIFSDGPTAQLILTDLYKELSDNQTAVAQADRRAEAMKEATAEVQRFLNLARLAGVNKTTNLRESLDQALDAALADKDKKEAALAELEKKQRMYEQQEAARRGIDLGQAEAEKITAGEAEGFVSGRGKALGEKPKSKRSWIVTRDSKAKVPKPAQAGALESAVQKAAALVSEARQEKEAAGEALKTQAPSAERIAALKESLASLESQINAHYTPAQAAEIQGEIDRIKAELASAPVPPAVANVAEQYNKASTTQAKKGEKAAEPTTFVQQTFAGTPASRAVAQLMFEKGSAELKAAGQLKAAEQAVTAANAKYDASRKALEQAEKKLARLKDPKKIQGVKLQIGNLNGSAPKLRDNIQDAIAARMDAERNYMAARLERLLLVQQMGEHAKREAANITTQLASAADTLVELQKQRDTATANEAAMRKKLDQSSAALEKAEDDAEAARQAARNAERLAEEKAKRDALDAAAEARKKAAEARAGAALPGRRVERDTSGKLMTAVQADIRQRMAAAETNLSKAIKAGNQDNIKKYTAEVEATTRELAQVYGKAPLAVSEVGAAAQAIKRAAGLTAKQKEKTLENIQNELDAARDALSNAIARNDAAAIKAADAKVEELITLRDAYGVQTATQPAVVEGMRSAPRREGPAVRYVRGGSKAIMQSGVVRLRAAGLSQEAANAVSLFVAKNKIRGAKDTAKIEELTQAFDALTDGMTEEQVNAAVAEGKRLTGLGPTVELIVKRMAYQEALENVSKAEQDLRDAKTNLTKELAQDALTLAEQRVEKTSNAYDQAKALYETSQIKRGKQAEKAAVEALFDETEIAQDTSGAKLGKGARRTAAAIEAGDEDMVAMEYTIATRTPADLLVQEAILEGRLLDALDRLSYYGANELIRESARDLKPLVLRTRVVINPNLTAKGEPVPAAYSPELNIVSFRPTAINDETIIHEVTHAVTLRVMRMPEDQLTARQLGARREIQAIFKQLKERTELAQQYGLKNAEEFVSEVQSNVEFRAAIDNKPWYKRLWHAILRLFGKGPTETLSERAGRMVKELYLPSKKLVGTSELVASAFRGPQPQESSIVGRPAGTLKTLQGNFFGLAGRVQLVDRLAAADKAFVEGQKAGNLSSLEAENAQYFMRMGDMTTQAAGQFITTGPVSIVKDRFDGRVEERYESRTGATLVNMAEYMERAGQEGLGSAQEVETLLTVKIAGDRANAIPRGWERLFSDNPAKAKAEYDAAVAKINANPAAKKFMDAAAAEYKAYNDGLMDFAEQTGFITAEDARRLKKTPYVPYYRIDNGVVKLFVDRETPMVIGNIKDNPDLQQLLGDNKQIMPILTSAVQNTFMLTRMGLRNKATQETAAALEKAGFVTKMGEGMGLANVNTVHYKYKGKPYFATIDADQFGIPADLIVKGMEGIKTTIPDIVRLMGIPADWIRTFVTRSPAYVLRQLIRDPMNAAITGGVDGMPVLNALKQFAKLRAGRNPSADALMRGLAVSSNIYTGNEQDMQKFLEAASSGRGKWSKMMGMFDQLALESDAATRTAIYEDGLKKGLSERQAQFRALEAQNFSRRGLSPSVQYLSTLVPFFNAQIQGLDALYRSFRGDMPFSEKLDIRKKLAVRGTLLAITALGYAFMMRDNEEYKKATPEERYSNFFVPLPGTKEMFKIPIPYEVGLLFKALPEAILDSILGDTKANEAAKGIGKLILQSAPGVIPAAGKPLLEAAYGQTMVGPIESEREKQLPAGQRYRETTPEVIKTLGSYTGEIGISPLLIEHFVKGYTSMLGVSVLRMLDPVMGEALDNKASTPLSKTPFIGGLFQTADGRFLIERAYNRMEEITQAVEGYKDLEKRGKKAEAQEFAQRKADLLAAADMAGTFRQRSGQMFADERAIRAEPSLTREQKDALLEKLKAAQQAEARQFFAASEKTTRPQPRP